MLRAANEKSRKGSTLLLRADLARDLEAWIQDRPSLTGMPKKSLPGKVLPAPADLRLFDVPGGLVRIFNRDLAAAGIAKRDERDRTLDIHSLRHTFATLLARGGVEPRTVQTAMRHSSLQMTGRYTDEKLLEVCKALSALPTIILESAAGHPVTSEPDPKSARVSRKKQDDPGASPASRFAPEFAPTSCFPPHSDALPCTLDEFSSAASPVNATTVTPDEITKKALPAGFAD